VSAALSDLAAGLRLCADAVEKMARAEQKPESGFPMTAKAAAKLLGVSAAEVYRQIRLGNMKALRIGKTVRIPADEFEAFRRRRIS